MSQHPRRCPSVPSSIQSCWSKFVAGWRHLWCAGRACDVCSERDPRRRDLFRPWLDFLENREAPDTLFGFALPAPWSAAQDLDNLGGGGLQPQGGALVGHLADLGSGYAAGAESTATAGAATPPAAPAETPTPAPTNGDDSWGAPTPHNPGTGGGLSDSMLPSWAGPIGEGGVQSASLSGAGVGGVGRPSQRGNPNDSSLPEAPGARARAQAKAQRQAPEGVVPRSRAQHDRRHAHRGHRHHRGTPASPPSPLGTASLPLLAPPSGSGKPAAPLPGAGTVAAPLLVSASNSGMLVTGPDAGGQPLVKVFDAATQHLRYQFLAYNSSFHGGVRVAVGDVNGDGTPDVVTGPGPGGGSQVRVFNGTNGTPFTGMLGGFNAYAAGQTNGIYVAAADVNGDGKADLICGTDTGAQPLVKVFSGANGSLLASFLADASSFTGGVRVAAGDVNGDGRADVITAAGPGGMPRVGVWDGVTKQQVYNFFAFASTFRGGVYIAAGDLNGDGTADLIAGAGSGSEVRAFSGSDTTPLGSFNAYASSFTGGVRVGTVDANSDGLLDIATAQAPTGGEARLFDGRALTQLAAFKPYGNSFHDGFFVGGDATASGGVGILDVLPTVTVTATTPDTAEGSSTHGVFTFTRTGSTSGSLVVSFTLSGTATVSSDYTASATSSVTIPSGSASATVTIMALTDTLYEPLETVVATLVASRFYDIGTPSSDVVSVTDQTGPPQDVPDDPPPCPEDDLVAEADGVDGDPIAKFSEGPVRYFDGTVEFATRDLSSEGFGTPWGQTRSWTNAPGYSSAGFNGSGWISAQLPSITQDSNGTIAVLSNGTTARLFDPDGSGGYTSRYFLQEFLSYNSGTGKFTLTDTTANQLVFFGFGTGLPANKRGRLESYTDPGGNVTSVTSWTTDGKAAEVQRSNTTGGTTVTESYLYTYLTSGTNAGLLSNVTLRRQINSGSWAVIRQVDYTYYDGTQSYGNAGDLMKAVVRDASGNALDTKYYRYYTVGQSGGYQHGLRYVFNPDSYARLAAAYADPTTATDAQVAPYADLYFEYDALRRVSTEVVQGAGCSSCSGGQGTYTFSYKTSTFPDGFDNWRRRTVETIPDGNTNTIYTNYAGQVLLKVFTDTSSSTSWEAYDRYDNNGREVLHAQPSAVSGYDDTRADLLNNQSGNYQYLRDSSGLLIVTDYGTSTTATSSTLGDVTGFRKDVKVQQGETGTAILQNARQYFTHSNGSVSVAIVGSTTAYRNTDGTGGETTSSTFTWFSGTNLVQSATVSLPTISSGQNGPGTADTEAVSFDTYGRPIWFKDGDGFLGYVAYDQATGAVTKTIADVDTGHSSDFTGLPSGWSTPTGGGLHLISQMEVDALGRSTKLTDPKGNISYVVYNDTNYEVRIYPGWNSSTNLPTGPTQVLREDRPGSYGEALTMSATPHLTSGRPDGTENIASLQTLARSYSNNAGQVVRSDAYFNLSGVTYSTAQYIGTQNTNFYTTQYAYDSRGRENRVQLPTGTIERAVYDGLGRVVSTWVGTNDTPGSGSWSPTNNTSPSNMVQVSALVYDGGGVGDSNLTQVTAIPGGSAANRVTQFFYDWRDRLVASKSGVQGTEDSTTHRPIFYLVLDNLGEVTTAQQYDGDGVTITTSGGVPQAPSSSLLRAQASYAYDDQGRVYQTQVYSVNPSSGAVSSTALTTNAWYNHRGELIKQANPGGLVTKTQYDGAGRPVTLYATDGGGDSSWSDAGNVTGDAVLSQVETTYDADGNAILTTDRERFHDETATGALGNPTTTPKARVSYAATYFDAANRPTAAVDVGTNGGSAWTRPSSVPTASDTVLVSSYAYNAAGWVSDIIDPRAIVAHMGYDNLGRTTQTIEAYTDGVPTSNTNKTTNFTYDGDGHLLTLAAVEVGGGAETTQYVYGVTTSSGSDVNSNDLLSAVKWPDKSTGNPSSSEQETYTLNALGDAKTYSDRNGSVHTYSYDVLGRLTADAVTTLGSGVDGAVRRLQTAYDTQGNAYLFTSYDASSGGNIVNQVQRSFNGLGQLTTEYQSHSGAVNTGTTPKVQYAYVEMASGANNSRLTSMTYPNSRVLNYNYASGLDSTISRLSSLSDSSATLETYAYLGLNTVVKRGHPQSGVDLTYIKQTGESNGDAGDQYTGLDRFGRVVDQRWLNTGTGTATDRFQYGYDRDGNVLYRDNKVNGAFSELYHANGASNGYDSLNQLTAFARGALSDTNSDGVPDTVSTASRSQSWNFDAVGNWSSVTTDGTAQSRTHNQQNEVTAAGSATLTFDGNGNTTTDDTGRTLAYDAWNRLVQVKSGSTVVASFTPDALGRRVVENTGTAHDLYYSIGGEVLEEQVSGQAQDQYVWLPGYGGTLVERDRDADANSSNGLEERLYAQQDANWTLTALVDTSGNVKERYAYDPYGTVTYLTPVWTTLGNSAYSWLYLHQGARYVSVAGLYSQGMGDESPTLGRWLNPDPGRFAGGDQNLYRTAANRPTDRKNWAWKKLISFSFPRPVDVIGNYLGNQFGLSPKSPWRPLLGVGAIASLWPLIGPGIMTWEATAFLVNSGIGVVNGVNAMINEAVYESTLLKQGNVSGAFRAATVFAAETVAPTLFGTPWGQPLYDNIYKPPLDRLDPVAAENGTEASTLFGLAVAAALLLGGGGAPAAEAGGAAEVAGAAEGGLPSTNITGITAEQAATLREAVERIEGHHHSAVYGSRAPGSSTPLAPASDIDVLVAREGGLPPPAEATQIENDISNLVGRRVHLNFMTPEFYEQFWCGKTNEHPIK
jgi:YD repeat-containing protein